jgi:hypothetical protein
MIRSRNRSWQDRRVVYTEEVIAFARVDENILLDAIPLAEVESIDSMQNLDQTYVQEHQPTNSFEAAIDFTFAFQIRTHKGGYNAGRKYLLRAGSEEEINSIIADLNHITLLAVQKAAARSYFSKIQKRVSAAYNSTIYQSISAVLIIAVSSELRLFFWQTS